MLPFSLKKLFNPIIVIVLVCIAKKNIMLLFSKPRKTIMINIFLINTFLKMNLFFIQINYMSLTAINLFIYIRPCLNISFKSKENNQII